MKSVTFPNRPIRMAGNIHLPKDFSKDRSYVAIVCVHPAGGVKEQTAGLYAAKLDDEGIAVVEPGCLQARREPRQEPAHHRGRDPHRHVGREFGRYGIEAFLEGGAILE
jgi:fermentation-respiration switch protein FrsA (DUF1100 family)